MLLRAPHVTEGPRIVQVQLSRYFGRSFSVLGIVHPGEPFQMTSFRDDLYVRLGIDAPRPSGHESFHPDASEDKASAIRAHLLTLCNLTPVRESDVRVSAFSSSTSVGHSDSAGGEPFPEREIKAFIAEVSTHLQVVAANACADRLRAQADADSDAATAESLGNDGGEAAGTRAAALEAALDRIDRTEASVSAALEADLVALDGALESTSEGLGLVREALAPGAVCADDLVALQPALQVRLAWAEGVDQAC